MIDLNTIPGINSLTIKEINETEKHILSAILFYYKQIKNIVNIEDTSLNFFITKTGRKLFNSFQKSPKNESIGYELADVITTLKTECKTENELRKCEEYLSDLSENFQHFTIQKNWDRLKSYNIKLKMNILANEILNTDINHQLISDQINKWKNDIDNISIRLSTSRWRTMKEVEEEWNKFIEDNYLNRSIPYLRTGYMDLDKKIKYLEPGHLMIIASRPGVGKTTFALNLLVNNLIHLDKENNIEAQGMGMLSLEMTNNSLYGKILALSSRRSFSLIEKMINGQSMEEEESLLINEAKKKLNRTNIFICDDVSITLGSLISNIKNLVTTNNLKVVIIDYLQLINTMNEVEQKWNYSPQYQKIGMISRALKLLALELKVCIIALSQLNREVEKRIGEDKSPILSDLRESGSIEQDADIVMFLYNDDNEKDKETTMLKIAKNRNGDIGKIKFTFDKSKGLYICMGEVND